MAKASKKRGRKRKVTFEERALKTYTDPRHPASLGGLRRLASALGDDGKKTLRWARGFEPYTLHKPVKRKFRRRKTIARGPGVQLQADLVDVSSHASRNEGTKFLLTAVDVFSRLAFVRPLRSKRGAEVARALADVLEGRDYETLQTDKGKEFLNADVERELEAKGVRRFSTENDDIKASLVERFNRTLRRKIHALLTHAPDNGYLDSLQDMVAAYNESSHGATGLPPAEVGPDNAEEVFLRLYESGGAPSPERDPLEPGDRVRVAKTRMAFTRGYTPNWTREIFLVVRRSADVDPPVYVIEDGAGEEIRGTFYRNELQRVEAPETYRVERVLKSRGRGKNAERLVKWLGYPESSNSWVRVSDITTT